MTNEDDGYDNIVEIAEEIFSKPPGPPNSIQLELEEDTSYMARDVGIADFVFQILYLITFNGIEKLYGHKNVQRLSESEFLHIVDYVKSYGYVLTVEANDTNKTPWQLGRDGIRVVNYKIGFDKL
jgi:hypothetical protein